MALPCNFCKAIRKSNKNTTNFYIDSNNKMERMKKIALQGTNILRNFFSSTKKKRRNLAVSILSTRAPRQHNR